MKQTLVSFNRSDSIDNLIPIDSSVLLFSKPIYATEIHFVNCCHNSCLISFNLLVSCILSGYLERPWSEGPGGGGGGERENKIHKERN